MLRYNHHLQKSREYLILFLLHPYMSVLLTIIYVNITYYWLAIYDFSSLSVDVLILGKIQKQYKYGQVIFN